MISVLLAFCLTLSAFAAQLRSGRDELPARIPSIDAVLDYSPRLTASLPPSFDRELETYRALAEELAVDRLPSREALIPELRRAVFALADGFRALRGPEAESAYHDLIRLGAADAPGQAQACFDGSGGLFSELPRLRAPKSNPYELLREPFLTGPASAPSGASRILGSEHGPRYRFEFPRFRTRFGELSSDSLAARIGIRFDPVLDDSWMLVPQGRWTPSLEAMRVIRSHRVVVAPGPRYLNWIVPLVRDKADVTFLAYPRRAPHRLYDKRLGKKQVMISFDGEFQHDVVDHVVGYVLLSEMPIWQDATAAIDGLGERLLRSRGPTSAELEGHRGVIADELETLTFVLSESDREGRDPLEVEDTSTFRQLRRQISSARAFLSSF